MRAPAFPAARPGIKLGRGVGFQTREVFKSARAADLEVGDTAGLEAYATKASRASWRQAPAAGVQDPPVAVQDPPVAVQDPP